MAEAKKKTKTVKRKKAAEPEREFSKGEELFLRNLAEATVRARIASRLGKSYQGDRDIYQELGYPEHIRLDDYFSKYRRHPVAKRVINAPVKKSWSQKPTVTDTQDEPSAFDEAWASLVKRRRVFHYLSRVDRLARVAEYAILVLGFDDGAEMSEEVTSANELLYLTPYSQQAATIDQYEDDPKNARYGRPKIYKIRPGDISTSSGKSSKRRAGSELYVHYSRVIHVAEGPLEDDNVGTPELEACYNDLMNIELVAGSSAEMYWRGAFPGMALLTQDGGWPDTQNEADIEEQVERYFHRFKRILRLTGIDVKELAQQVSDPTGQVKVYMMMVSCATGIPMRKLMGSEKGELSSVQDEGDWAELVSSRRLDHCEPVILRPTVDTLVKVGVIPEPTDGPGEYQVNWPDLFAPSDEQKAETGVKRATALEKFVNALGAEQVVPIEIALKILLGLDDDEIEEIINVREAEPLDDPEEPEGGEDAEG